MSLYSKVCAGLLFPLHERLKGHDSVAIRQRLEQSQWATPAALASDQAQRLRAFLMDIGAQVPYYRQVFAELHFDPAAVDSVQALRALPFLTKTVIRSHQEQLKALDHGPLARYNTGGSSGEPLIFFIGKQRSSHDVAAKWRATRWWGVDIGDPEMVIWGSPIELGAQDRVRRLRDAMLRSSLLPAFEMSEAKLGQFVQAISQRRPRMLFGYPSALTHIAQYAKRHGVALNDLGIRVVFVTSERLYDEQRQAISEAFGCPVANGYGGRDAGFIAHECPQGGMHLMSEDIIVELVDQAGEPVPDGQPGEVVVTHMGTRDFPFVRYRTGDVAVKDSRTCACGRGLPMLKEIQGRTTDFVVAADGTVMHGLSLIYILRDLPGIQAFKVIQETREHCRVLLVVGDGFSPDSTDTIVAGFKRRLGDLVRVDVDRVAEIAPERSGKFRYIVSHAVTQPRQ